MSERESPASAPCCGEVVDAIDALDADECPECGTDLREMFRLARDDDRVDAEAPAGGADDYRGP